MAYVQTMERREFIKTAAKAVGAVAVGAAALDAAAQDEIISAFQAMPQDIQKVVAGVDPGFVDSAGLLVVDDAQTQMFLDGVWEIYDKTGHMPYRRLDS